MNIEKRIKTGGRKKGTPNKVTGEVRERIKAFIDDELDNIIDDFSTLDAKDKIILFEKFLSYVLPKQKEIDVTSGGNDLDLSSLSDDELNQFHELLMKASPQSDNVR